MTINAINPLQVCIYIIYMLLLYYYHYYIVVLSLLVRRYELSTPEKNDFARDLVPPRSRLGVEPGAAPRFSRRLDVVEKSSEDSAQT